jgi:hypothetical protein
MKSGCSSEWLQNVLGEVPPGCGKHLPGIAVSLLTQSVRFLETAAASRADMIQYRNAFLAHPGISGQIESFLDQLSLSIGNPRSVL